MSDISKRTLKILAIIGVICLYYVMALIMASYVLSMSQKSFFTNMQKDFRYASQKRDTFSVDTKKSFGDSVSIDTNNYMKEILGNSSYRNAYIIISTLLLFIIALFIYINMPVKREEKPVSKKNEGLDNAVNWLQKPEIKILKQKNILASKQGIILGKHGKFQVVSIPESSKLNKHTLVIGSSGSGKSSAFMKTNILNLSNDLSSFVVSDPKGEFYKDTADILKEKGYYVKVFNLSNISHSSRWNPFDSVEDGLDAHYLAETIVEKISRDSKEEVDKNLQKVEKELIKNLIIYLKENFDKQTQNMTGLYTLISTLKHEEIDGLFEHDKEILKLTEFNFYLQQSQETKKAAINDLINKLKDFDKKQVSDLLKVSEIRFEMLKIRPCAYYLIFPDMHEKYDLIATMFVMEAIKRVTEVHDDTKDETIIKREVYFMLDDFINFGYIPKLANKLSQLRARRINCSIIINSINSLKSVYTEDECKEIINHSDIKLFYGCNEEDTAKYVADVLSKNLNSEVGTAININDLINLDTEKCIAVIRGQKPILLNKYDWINTNEYKIMIGNNQVDLVKWIKNKANELAKKQSGQVKIVEPKVKIYEYENNVIHKNESIVYYNDFVPKMKIPSKAEDTTETKI